MYLAAAAPRYCGIWGSESEVIVFVLCLRFEFELSIVFFWLVQGGREDFRQTLMDTTEPSNLIHIPQIPDPSHRAMKDTVHYCLLLSMQDCTDCLPARTADIFEIKGLHFHKVKLVQS